MFGRLATCATAFLLLFASQVSAEAVEPYAVSKARVSGLCKNESSQVAKNRKWQSFAGCEPFAINGDRSLFFAQLHLTCTKRPRYVKVRLARLLPDGKKDTTGTTTWVLGKDAPLIWEGTTWWESNTRNPIVAQFKVVGGKCVSDQRQIKWWMP